MLRLILLGPQGSGKGTQAELLVRKFEVPYISTGNILRENIHADTELGKKANGYIKTGRLVPDDIVMGIVKDRLSRPDCKKGFLLDGFPRNISQAEWLKKTAEIDALIEINISDREAIRRISGRRNCKCGAVYHVFHNPPKVDELCDKCKSKLFQREDDKEEAIRKRLEIYHNETKPLVSFYAKKHMRINGEQTIEKVFGDIIGELKRRKLPN